MINVGEQLVPFLRLADNSLASPVLDLLATEFGTFNQVKIGYFDPKLALTVDHYVGFVAVFNLAGR